MEQLPRISLTLAIVFLIIGLYQHITLGIKFQQAGVNTEATVTSRELHEAYCYVQFKYKADGSERKGSLRLEPAAKDKFTINQKFLVRYVPGRPDDVRPDTTGDNRNEMYYFMMFTVAFAVYITTKAMAGSFRPHD